MWLCVSACGVGAASLRSATPDCECACSSAWCLLGVCLASAWCLLGVCLASLLGSFQKCVVGVVLWVPSWGLSPTLLEESAGLKIGRDPGTIPSPNPSLIITT